MDYLNSLYTDLYINSTALREGLDVVLEGLADTGAGVYHKGVDLVILPFAAFLISVFETSLKYLLEEGEYEKYEEATAQSYHIALSWLQLSPFQSKLIWEFFVIILGNCLLLILAWWWYGERIRSQFMQTGSDRRLRNFEEIRDGYSELKLPSEMDFKFK